MVVNPRSLIMSELNLNGRIAYQHQTLFKNHLYDLVNIRCEDSIGEICADREDEKSPNIRILQSLPHLVPLDVVFLPATVCSSNTFKCNFFLSCSYEIGGRASDNWSVRVYSANAGR